VSGSAALELRNVSVTYQSPTGEVNALADASCIIASGTATTVIGRSGSGKSTLLSVLSLLRTPTKGQVLVDGFEVSGCGEAEISQIRSRRIGVVFQSYHLDPAATAVENVMFPWFFNGRGSFRDARKKAGEKLELLEIGGLARRRPEFMSGGQRQRVAIARALFHDPLVLVADEPTGNLDEETAVKVADALFGLIYAGTAVVVVTHDPEIAAMAERTLVLKRGVLSEP
jgi:ABC-type lipoprotein export system ATPase subunit